MGVMRGGMWDLGGEGHLGEGGLQCCCDKGAEERRWGPHVASGIVGWGGRWCGWKWDACRGLRTGEVEVWRGGAPAVCHLRPAHLHLQTPPSSPFSTAVTPVLLMLPQLLPGKIPAGDLDLRWRIETRISRPGDKLMMSVLRACSLYFIL